LPGLTIATSQYQAFWGKTNISKSGNIARSDAQQNRGRGRSNPRSLGQSNALGLRIFRPHVANPSLPRDFGVAPHG